MQCLLPLDSPVASHEFSEAAHLVHVYDGVCNGVQSNRVYINKVRNECHGLGRDVLVPEETVPGVDLHGVQCEDDTVGDVEGDVNAS